MTPTVSIIVAHNLNNVIGDKGTIPWHSAKDLAHFKSVTMGHPIIMGRKTWESLPKPLEGRTNIVITNHPNYMAKGAIIAYSLENALNLASEIDKEQIFVIGGGTVYQQALKYAHNIYVTLFQDKSDGDTKFPYIQEKDWSDKGINVPVDDGMSFHILESTKFPASYDLVEAPEVDTCWHHTNGNIYCVRSITNQGSTSTRYPETVVYEGTNGKLWSRPVSEWHRSLTLLEASASVLGFDKPNPALAVLNFAFGNTDPSVSYEATEETVTLLNMWYHGDFQEMRDTWPDIPDEVFIGADPLFKPKE